MFFEIFDQSNVGKLENISEHMLYLFCFQIEVFLVLNLEQEVYLFWWCLTVFVLHLDLENAAVSCGRHRFWDLDEHSS